MGYYRTSVRRHLPIPIWEAGGAIALKYNTDLLFQMNLITMKECTDYESKL